MKHMNLIQRLSVITLVLLTAACAAPLGYETGNSMSPPNPLPTVRAPQVGQEWVYSKKNVFNSKELGIITERVSSVGSQITITRTTADGGQLPSEIQGPWGMISTDPHWARVISYSPAIPLWPQNLSGNWSKQANTKYQIAGYDGNFYNWNLYMSSNGWEQITVPAGTFSALRFQNLIYFENADPNKVDCVRKETIWFAPQIGRWVARESTGSCKIQGQINNESLEDTTQWQLQSYK